MNPAPQFQAGSTHGGYRIVAVTPLPELRATAIQAEHQRSGARVLHLACADTENCFAIAFPTPPADSTGLPHILEHSVLGGSRKYPVREPFFEMVKMSMATFINAFTSQAFTCYPIATNVKKDYFNLVSVYLDAVFHPLIAEPVFRREGHHLALAKSDDPSSPLTISGIVYNEMKGYYSMPETIAWNLACRGLFEGSHLGEDSGGNPDCIPSLTYAQFKQFHETLYHPSNALVFLYGNIDTREQLDFLAPVLDEYERRPVNVAMPRPAAWLQPRSAIHRYAVGPADPLEQRTYHMMTWHVGNALDPAEVVDWAVLTEVLLGNESAPLRKALVDSRLGEDLFFHGGDSLAHELLFCAGIKGSEPQHAESFGKVLLGALERLSAAPFPDDRVAAAYQQLSYAHLEVTPQFPMKVMWDVQSIWPYGHDPLTFLGMSRHIEASRRRVLENPMQLPGMIRAKLLSNPHRLQITLRPDREVQAEADRCHDQQMSALKKSMTEEDLRRVGREAAELEAAQSVPNSPEALAMLPQLAISDLPRSPRNIPTTVGRMRGIPSLRNDVFANGVNYLDLDVDLSDLAPGVLRSLPRYCDAFRKMGAAGESYEHIALRRAACTGGLDCGWFVSRPVLADGATRRSLRISLKTLDGTATAAFKLLGNLLFDLDPSDRERLRDVLFQARASYRTALVNDGLSTARRHASQGLSDASSLDYTLTSRDMLGAVDAALANFDAAAPGVAVGIDSIRKAVSDPARWTLSFTGSDATWNELERVSADWRAAGAPGPRPCALEIPAGGSSRDGLAAPVKVAHCVQAMPAPHTMHPDAPCLNLGLYLLRFDYFLPEIRFKGNAYGAGISFDEVLGVLHMHSYDDPRIVETLRVFERVPDVVRSAGWTQTDINRAIIGSAKAVERPIRPGEATVLAMNRHLRGDSDELRAQRYQAALGATPSAVQAAVLRHVEAGLPRKRLCVLSSREKLEAANAAPGAAGLKIADLLP